MKTVKANIRFSDLEKMDFLCAWNGCDARYPIKDGLPSDWVNLLVWAGKPNAHRTINDVCSDQLCYRDTCLCPKHAAEFLQRVLRPLPPKGIT